MNGVTMDSTKVLTEKLALARELATLKPELEHLRSQAAYQQTVLSEKLALQRRVSTLEVELETEKRSSKRAAEKSKNKEKELALQQQLEDIQKELAQEKREREKASKEAEKQLEAERRALKSAIDRSKEKEKELELQYQHQLERLQEELTQEKKEREKARKEAEKELAAERRAAKRADEKNSNKTERQLEDLQKDLDQERREKEEARKQAEKELSKLETQKTLLESKLEQMRTKLRATKEQLNECQTELGQVRASMAKGSSASSRADIPAKNARKRTGVDMNTDITIGTPDGAVAGRGKRPAVKRGRIDQTVVGEKSMFSITPYLNRTVNMAPESPVQDDDESAAEDEDGASGRAAGDVHQLKETSIGRRLDDKSSTALVKSKPQSKTAEKRLPAKKVLSETDAGTSNKKLGPKSRKTSTLEKVSEEGENDENEEPDSAPTVIGIDAEKGIPKVSKVQMKNVEETEPKKKKRKLLGGGKTLFDEEDGEATKRPAKVTLGPPRLLGKGGLAGPKGGLGGTGSGFGAFSPLKKDRRGAGASFLA
jgi:myosin heavy subunit